MRAGELRHRVKVDRQARTQDPRTGVMNVEWQYWRSLWVKFEPLSVRDTLAAQAAGSQIIARITFRYSEELESSMRVRYRGKTYLFDGLLPDARSGFEYITVPVREGLSE